MGVSQNQVLQIERQNNKALSTGTPGIGPPIYRNSSYEQQARLLQLEPINPGLHRAHDEAAAQSEARQDLQLSRTRSGA